MDQDNGIKEQPSTSKITQKAESHEKVNGIEKEDGSDRHSETSGTNSRSINSKIEVAKIGPTITLGPKEVKQQLQSKEPKKRHTRSTGRVEKRTLPRRDAVRRPVKRARRDPKVEYKRKRDPSYTTVFTRLTSATSIGSCKYCGHRCCKRRYEITRRVRAHKRKRRKRQIRIIYNCVSTQTTGSVGVQAESGTFSHLRIDRERSPEHGDPENLMYSQITPDMIFNSLRSLTMWRNEAHFQTILHYVQTHFPVNPNKEELEAELEEKLRVAVIVGIATRTKSQSWKLSCQLENRELTDNHVTLFWVVYGDTMTPIFTKKIQSIS